MTRTVRHCRRWVPLCILLAFVLGLFWAWPEAKGQTSQYGIPPPNAATNAMDIAVLNQKFRDLGDVTAQVEAIRERLVKLESAQKDVAKQLDKIANLEQVIALGIGGIFVTIILRKIRLTGDREGESGVFRTLE